jgi:hypothetical protein
MRRSDDDQLPYSHDRASPFDDHPIDSGDEFTQMLPGYRFMTTLRILEENDAGAGTVIGVTVDAAC